MLKSAGQSRVDFLGLCMLSDFSVRISHFSKGKFNFDYFLSFCTQLRMPFYY